MHALPRDGRAPLLRARSPKPVSFYEQALVFLSNREIVDASRGRTFHCKMANNRLITVFFSNWVGLIYLAV